MTRSELPRRQGDPVQFTFAATLWEYAGEKATWVFLTLPTDTADQIEELTRGHTGGFGSVRVAVNIGETHWQTSLFPDSKAGSYILPVKKAVRVAEGVQVGDEVEVGLIV